MQERPHSHFIRSSIRGNRSLHQRLPAQPSFRPGCAVPEDAVVSQVGMSSLGRRPQATQRRVSEQRPWERWRHYALEGFCRWQRCPPQTGRLCEPRWQRRRRMQQWQCGLRRPGPRVPWPPAARPLLPMDRRVCAYQGLPEHETENRTEVTWNPGIVAWSRQRRSPCGGPDVPGDVVRIDCRYGEGCIREEQTRQIRPRLCSSAAPQPAAWHTRP